MYSTYILLTVGLLACTVSETASSSSSAAFPEQQDLTQNSTQIAHQAFFTRLLKTAPLLNIPAEESPGELWKKQYTDRTPNGKYVVSGSDEIAKLNPKPEDWRPRIYDASVEPRKLLHILAIEHREAVANSVVCSPDSKFLATGSHHDSLVEIWNVEHGTKLHTLKGEWGAGGFTFWISFSPNNTYLAAASSNGITNVWNYKTGELIHTLDSSVPTEERRPAYRAFFSPDNNFIAVGSMGKAEIWDAHSGALLQKLEPVVSYSFLNPRTLKTESMQKPEYTQLLSLAFSPDSKLVATGCCSDSNYDAFRASTEIFKIILWDILTGKELYRLHHPNLAICTIRFSPEGNALIAQADRHPRKNIFKCLFKKKIESDQSSPSTMDPDAPRVITWNLPFPDAAQDWKNEN